MTDITPLPDAQSTETAETFEAWMDSLRNNRYWRSPEPQTTAIREARREAWDAAIKSCGIEYVRVCKERDAAESAASAMRAVLTELRADDVRQTCILINHTAGKANVAPSMMVKIAQAVLRAALKGDEREVE